MGQNYARSLAGCKEDLLKPAGECADFVDMTKSTLLPRSSPAFRQLEDLLREPEPMCLAVVKLSASRDISAIAEYRLRENLRPYDQLWRLDGHTYAMSLKTMADAATLQSSIERMFLLLSDPYGVDGGYERAVVTLGASVRQPQDTATGLLERVGEAMSAAESEGCVGPILL